MIDITMILQGLIVLLVGLAAFKLWPIIKASVPAIVLDIIRLVARFAVYSVEASFGSGGGEEKFKAALEMAQDWLERYGFTFDTDMLYNAIKEEWYKMNLEQIQTGIKKPESTEKTE